MSKTTMMTESGRPLNNEDDEEFLDARTASPRELRRAKPPLPLPTLNVAPAVSDVLSRSTSFIVGVGDFGVGVALTIGDLVHVGEVTVEDYEFKINDGYDSDNSNNDNDDHDHDDDEEEEEEGGPSSSSGRREEEGLWKVVPKVVLNAKGGSKGSPPYAVVYSGSLKSGAPVTIVTVASLHVSTKSALPRSDLIGLLFARLLFPSSVPTRRLVVLSDLPASSYLSLGSEPGASTTTTTTTTGSSVQIRRLSTPAHTASSQVALLESPNTIGGLAAALMCHAAAVGMVAVAYVAVGRGVEVGGPRDKEALTELGRVVENEEGVKVVPLEEAPLLAGHWESLPKSTFRHFYS